MIYLLIILSVIIIFQFITVVKTKRQFDRLKKDFPQLHQANQNILETNKKLILENIKLLKKNKKLVLETITLLKRNNTKLQS